MPYQIFEIIRAPEAEPLTAKELRDLIWESRRDSEWVVIEKKAPMAPSE